MIKILTLVFGSVFTLFMTKAWGNMLSADNNQTSPWIKVLTIPTSLNIPQLDGLSPVIKKPIRISATTILLQANNSIIKYNKENHKFSLVKGTYFSNRWHSNVVLNAAYINNTLYVFGKNYLFHKSSGYGRINNGLIWINKWSLFHGSESGVSSIQRTPIGGISFIHNFNSSRPYLYACTKTISNCKKVVERRVVAYTWSRSGALYYIPFKGNQDVLVGPKSTTSLNNVAWVSYISKMYDPPFISLNNGKFVWYNTIFNTISRRSEVIKPPPRMEGAPEFWLNNHLYALVGRVIYKYTLPL
jgi:hypothetical protein